MTRVFFPLFPHTICIYNKIQLEALQATARSFKNSLPLYAESLNNSSLILFIFYKKILHESML